MTSPKSIDKLVEQISEMSVLEAAELSQALKDKLGIADIAPVAAPTAAAPAAAVEDEKTEFKVTLKSAGSERIKVIKALRKVVANLGLTDAKKMVEEAPTVVGEEVPKDKAEEMKKALKEAGAEVELS